MSDILQYLDGLNHALNEATVLGLDLDLEKRYVYVTISPIALLVDGSVPKDNRLLLAFENVGRIAASLTPGQTSKAMAFEPSKLAEKFDEFKYEKIYGWEFINNGENLFKRWQEDKSFDLILLSNHDQQNTMDLFQEDKYSSKSIDVRIWFEHFHIYDNELCPVEFETFISNGKRGWEKLYASGWTINEDDLRGKLKFAGML